MSESFGISKPVSDIQIEVGWMIIRNGEALQLEDDGGYDGETKYAYGPVTDGLLIPITGRMLKTRNPADFVRGMGWTKKKKERFFHDSELVFVKKTITIER
jgi:hypothetical protein